ncbi:fimbrial protein [Achromobacter sp. JUb104]|uniref:fimbrial protein n=1 Tax=Achromobacter sp. JUb104 TaxID=2940590 RepID=UPI00216A10E3|nr:fimbrial protein [Achromobacter sp. JUb104]MCS3509261.1 type 1 fimbria pilin [Achromobacter sp. JUb104]
MQLITGLYRAAGCRLPPIMTRVSSTLALSLTVFISSIFSGASAGPLDTRAVACTVNSGGTTSKGNKYLAYLSVSNNYMLSPIRTEQPLPTSAIRGDVLFSTSERTYQTLEGESQGLAAPLYNCPPGTMESFTGSGAYDSASRSYATGLQGIGYRVYYYIGGGEELAAPQQFSNPYALGALVFPFSSSARGNYRTRIDFVATGEVIKPGTIYANRVYGAASVSAAISGMPSLFRVGLERNIHVSTPTCTVKNPGNLVLSLGDVSVVDLNAGLGEKKIFETELQVACSAASQVSPTVRLSSGYMAGATYPGALLNQEPNGAKGVGIRLWLYDPAIGQHRAATFNNTDANRGTAIGAKPTSTWSFKFGASYLRVGGMVNAGTFKSTATVTFTYS